MIGSGPVCSRRWSRRDRHPILDTRLRRWHSCGHALARWIALQLAPFEVEQGLRRFQRPERRLLPFRLLGLGHDMTERTHVLRCEGFCRRFDRRHALDILGPHAQPGYCLQQIEVRPCGHQPEEGREDNSKCGAHRKTWPAVYRTSPRDALIHVNEAIEMTHFRSILPRN